MKHDNVNASKMQVVQLAYNQALFFGYRPLTHKQTVHMTAAQIYEWSKKKYESYPRSKQKMFAKWTRGEYNPLYMRIRLFLYKVFGEKKA